LVAAAVETKDEDWVINMSRKLYNDSKATWEDPLNITARRTPSASSRHRPALFTGRRVALCSEPVEGLFVKAPPLGIIEVVAPSR